MPTGYTAKLMEEGQTFSEFAIGCARAFGALIEMRDEPADAPIPDKFEPSNYHTKELANYNEELNRLLAMDKAQQLALGNQLRERAIQAAQDYLARCQGEDQRVKDMLAKVNKWQPPTKEHTGLKEFMVEQLTISLRELDWPEQALKEATELSPEYYYRQALERTKHNVSYHLKEQADATQQAQERTLWVQELRRSLL